MIHLDIKYINLLKPKLRNFKKKHERLWLFSCPICKDSQKDITKARGYAFVAGRNLICYCHNCGISLRFDNFLKTVDPFLFKEYSFEKYKDKKIEYKEAEEKKVDPIKISDIFESLQTIAELSIDHPAHRYIVNREIPYRFHHQLFYCPEFKQWTNSIVKEKFDSLKGDFESIIIPFYSFDKEVIGYQGRVFNINTSSGFRYVTIRLVEDDDMVFGLDRVKLDQKIFVVEGPFDSMFLDNSIAIRSSTVQIPDKIKKVNFTMIFDNEPRNKQIINHMKNYVLNGHKIVVWDSYIRGKDINEMIIKGETQDTIKKYIEYHTYEGTEALERLRVWKRC